MRARTLITKNVQNIIGSGKQLLQFLRLQTEVGAGLLIRSSHDENVLASEMTMGIAVGWNISRSL